MNEVILTAMADGPSQTKQRRIDGSVTSPETMAKVSRNLEENGVNRNSMDIRGASAGSSPGARVIMPVNGQQQKEVVDKFWKLTDRKKKMKKEHDFGPAEFHNWGEINNIKERSPTLNHFVTADSMRINDVKKNKETLELILTELELSYEVENLPTLNKSQVAMVYNVESVPNWSFFGLGDSEKEAIARAAKQGLEFLCVLSDY